MEEVRKRRQLKPKEKFQIYNEATVAKAQTITLAEASLPISAQSSFR